jgi:hypothetical protein
MWFGFGLITLLVAFFVSIHSRTSAKWSGEQRHLKSQQRYYYRETRQKGRLQRVRIGIDAPPNFQFTARDEVGRDRFFKNLGIASELQLHDDEFDDDVYLEADAKGVATLLSESKQLRTTLLEILRYARQHDLRGMRIRCAHQRLWLEFLPKREGALFTYEKELVPMLYQLTEGMKNSRLTERQLHDPFVWRAAMLLSISTASAILGGFGLMRGIAGRTDIIDAWPLFYSSVTAGLVITALFVVAVFKILGRSSRTHLVLIEGVLVGTIGFCFSMYALAREANITFDIQRPQVHELRDINVEHVVSHGRRTHHNFYLHTADWRAKHVSEPLKLEITRAEYDRLEGKNSALVYGRGGALGYEWIERVVPVPTPE